MIVITTLGWKVLVNYCPRIWIPCLYFLQKNNFFSIDLALICISQSIVGVGSKFSFTSSIFIFLNYYWEISQLSACTAIRHCFIYNTHSFGRSKVFCKINLIVWVSESLQTFNTRIQPNSWVFCFWATKISNVVLKSNLELFFGAFGMQVTHNQWLGKS